MPNFRSIAPGSYTILDKLNIPPRKSAVEMSAMEFIELVEEFSAWDGRMNLFENLL